MKNWEFFNERLIYHTLNVKHKLFDIQSVGENEEDFTAKIVSAFEEAKVFEINEDIKELLKKTKGTKDIENLPFDCIFVDVNFDVSEFNEYQFEFKIVKVVGLLIHKVNAIEQIDGKEYIATATLDLKTFKGNYGYRIIYLALDEQDNGYAFNTVNVVDHREVMDEYKGYNIKFQTNVPKIRKFLLEYSTNLLNLINNPERNVTFVEKEYSPAKNRQRERKGLIRIPNSKIILPVGDLKVYINRMKQNPDFHYSHRFWVRGHWRMLKSPRYKDSKRTWILPYVKGTGVLLNKTYLVKEENKNEKEI